jgi:site-specific DNA recombinase
MIRNRLALYPKKRDGKSWNHYPFSGEIICGNCGGTFKRRILASGKHRNAWCCTTHFADIAECPVKYIPNSALEVAFVTKMNKLIFGHQTETDLSG